MRITSTYINKNGQPEERSEIIKDVRVWREYRKRRYALEAETLK
jgi:transcription initiation factor TFIID subunit 1